MRFASFRVRFFGSQRCRDTFSHIATFPAATADRARNTPLTPIGKCRALGLDRGVGPPPDIGNEIAEMIGFPESVAKHAGWCARFF